MAHLPPLGFKPQVALIALAVFTRSRRSCAAVRLTEPGRACCVAYARCRSHDPDSNRHRDVSPSDVLTLPLVAAGVLAGALLQQEPEHLVRCLAALGAFAANGFWARGIAGFAANKESVLGMPNCLQLPEHGSGRKRCRPPC